MNIAGFAEKVVLFISIVITANGFARHAYAQQPASTKPVVVQPGAPGKATRILPSKTKAKLPPLSAADVQFMQGMIMHHAQAVEMTALIESHTENKDVKSLGARISHSQSDEIAFMKRWLVTRGQPQGDTENCVAHNGSLVPVPGRDIKVQAWYQGGISIMDFTDENKPMEIAYFDRGAIDPKMLILGGDWSAYWYNGHIYASEIARGLDIFALSPSELLTQNEIDAAKTVQVAELNVQNQQKIVWPAKLIVAKAYLDQLERSQALPADQITAMRSAIQTAESSQLSKGRAKLQSLARSLKESAPKANSAVDGKRMQALAEILQRPTK